LRDLPFAWPKIRVSSHNAGSLDTAPWRPVNRDFEAASAGVLRTIVVSSHPGVPSELAVARNSCNSIIEVVASGLAKDISPGVTDAASAVDRKVSVAVGRQQWPFSVAQLCSPRCWARGLSTAAARRLRAAPGATQVHRSSTLSRRHNIVCCKLLRGCTCWKVDTKQVAHQETPDATSLALGTTPVTSVRRKSLWPRDLVYKKGFLCPDTRS
jgi:hypothetical protein